MLNIGSVGECAQCKPPGTKPGDLAGHSLNQTWRPSAVHVIDSSLSWKWPNRSWEPFSLESIVDLIPHPVGSARPPSKKARHLWCPHEVKGSIKYCISVVAGDVWTMLRLPDDTRSWFWIKSIHFFYFYCQLRLHCRAWTNIFFIKARRKKMIDVCFSQDYHSKRKNTTSAAIWNSSFTDSFICLNKRLF